MLKKGFVGFIPLVAIATVIVIGAVGVAGSVRSTTISSSSVLASSSSGGSENGKSNKSDSSGKSNKNTNTQAVNNSSEQGKKDETPGLEKSNAGVGGTNRQESKKIDSVEVEVDEGEDTQEATPVAKSGRKIRTNFPITINPVTNEKTVTTPGGVKTIILPEVAIQNMIKAGFPVVLPPEDEPDEGSPSASPEATPSGATESGAIEVGSDAEIELTEVDGELVYEIPALKDEQFLGIVGVKIKVKGIVSAEDGQIIKIQKSFFDNLLDFFSF